MRIELEIINSWRAWQVEVDFDFILYIIIHLLGIVRYIPIWKTIDLQTHSGVRLLVG